MNQQEGLSFTPKARSAADTRTNMDNNYKVANLTNVRKKLYDLNSSNESLGILTLDDINISKDHVDIKNIELTSRAITIEKTRNLLEKLKSEASVTESYLQQNPIGTNSPMNSTVNESDLLASRFSNISSKADRTRDQSVCREQSVSRYIEDLKAKFQCNSTASFNEILADHSKNSFLSTTNNDLNVDSGLFVPAAECKEQFSQDEKQWKQQYSAMPANPVNITKSSFLSMSTPFFDDKMSIGEFFQGKTENFSAIFGKGSPERSTTEHLVNSTTIEDDRENSSSRNSTAENIINLSDIKNLLTSQRSTPSQISQRLLQPNTKSNESLNKKDYFNPNSFGSPTANSSKFSKQYASSQDLRPSRMASDLMKSMSYVGNKENIPQNEERNRTVSSIRTSSSMATIAGGSEKISIASTKSELVWGCIRDGRSNTQSFTIRNKHHRRVIYTVHSSNSSYKLADCQSNKASLVLHPLETREVQVIFNPTTVGPQVGHLIFTPVIHKREQPSMQQRISLFGYGGHVSIDVIGQTRDLSGKLWVSLGHIEGKQTMCAEFVVANVGSIDGFASFTISPKLLCAYEDVEIEPAHVIIKRGSEKRITLKFRPTKSDLAILADALSNKATRTAEIGVIKMISGANINRQRIVKINKKIQKEYGLKSDLLQQQLASQYHGDATLNSEINCFSESVASTRILMQYLDSTEISLLVDRDPDDSILPEADDTTVIFRTLASTDENCSLDEPKTDNSFMKYFNFEPLMLILTPPSKSSDFVLLTSHYSRKVSYQISITPTDILTVTNWEGHLRPEETKMVHISCPRDFSGNGRQDFKIMVDIEYECITAHVSIIPNL